MGVASSAVEKTKAGAGWLGHLYHPRTWKEKGILWSTGVLLITVALGLFILSFFWGQEPDLFDVRVNALQVAEQNEEKLVPGYVSSATVIRVASTLLHKPGGYLSNDVMPPGVLMDNIPNWEYGVLVQLRDMARSMRQDFARSRSQSIEDKDLQIADPQFNFNSESWILPATETEYEKGIEAMRSYMDRLSDTNEMDGQFFARADNLRDYLQVVERRLGNFAQRLAASVGQARFDINLAGDRAATQSKPTPSEQTVKTGWWELDDVFYEARGGTWALLHFLKALEYDLRDVLEEKNADVLLRQIIRELEGSQDPMWSPVVLNGTGYGVVANHSLVLASYVARASAAIIDLRQLLLQ